jgi:hypothetical protein
VIKFYMKLLITGGAGFVGARLARTLLARGAREAGSHRAGRDGRPGRRAGRPAGRRPRAGPRGHLAGRSARRCATRTSTACSTWRRRCRASARPTSTSACAPTSTARARCSTPCATARARGRPTRLVFSSSVAVFGPDPAMPLRRHRGRRHAAHAADQLRHAQADLRAPDRRLHAQGLHRRPRGPADDGDGAPGPAQRRGQSFFSGIIREPLAGEDRSARCRPTCRTRCPRRRRTVDGLIAVYEASREAFAAARR